MSPGLYRGKESSSSVPQESVESSSLPFSAVWLVSPCRRAAVPPCRRAAKSGLTSALLISLRGVTKAKLLSYASCMVAEMQRFLSEKC